MVTAVESDGAMSGRRLINQWCNIRTTQVGTLMVTAVASDGAMTVRRLINQWCNIRTTQVGTLMVTAVELDGAMTVRRLINQWCNIRTTQVGTLMVTAVVRWCHECKKTHHPVLKYQNYTGRYTYSDFIWPFLRPYMGVIPNPKMAFIFPTSCILALFFPILLKYSPKCKRKGSFLKF